MDQLTFFNSLPKMEYPDFREISIEQIADIVGNEVGVVFKKTYDDYYEGKDSHKIEYNLKLSHYVYKEREGEPFISLGIFDKRDWSGLGVGCDSIADVIKYIEDWRNKHE